MSNVPSGAGAVMASRREDKDGLDFFPTPPWATRALLEHVIGNGWRNYSCWEPACGHGDMVRPLREYFQTVAESDIEDYYGNRTHDFTMPYLPDHWIKPDWVITNPPFNEAEKFVDRGMSVARVGVALFVRLQWLEGIGRYRSLFSVNPPAIIAQFTERVPILRGRLSKGASSATAYCWIVWRKETRSTSFMWIPPCRAKLERVADYNTGVPSGSSPRSIARADGADKPEPPGPATPVHHQPMEMK